jgi:hypothetical protein
MIAQQHEANSGDNLVSSPLKLFEHSVSLFEAGRLAKQSHIKTNQSVRAEDERIGIFFGNRTRFSIRVDLRGFANAELIMVNLRHRARNDFEIERQLSEQLRASRRT